MKDIHNSSTQRITTQQQVVFQLVKKASGHVAADQIYQEVRKTLPRISLATVYRNLEKLADNQLIGKTIIKGVFYFELETAPHYHVICLSCGAIDNIDSGIAGDIESHFARATSYKLTSHDLVLYGVCPNCQKKR